MIERALWRIIKKEPAHLADGDGPPVSKRYATMDEIRAQRATLLASEQGCQGERNA
jgi:hypothetical protein